MYLDRLWQMAGVEPNDPLVALIEARVRIAAVQEIINGFADLRREVGVNDQQADGIK
jgi:hypothetical protein